MTFHQETAAEILALINAQPRSPTTSDIQTVLEKRYGLGSVEIQGHSVGLEDSSADTIYLFTSDRNVEKLVGGVRVVDWSPSREVLLALTQAYDAVIALRGQ